jgi:hypothetical protein
MTMDNTLTARSFGAQDQWIRSAAVDTEGLYRGTFLDIGCANPIDGSNTFELERCGWHGVLVDINADLKPLIAAARTSPFVCMDAAAINWPEVLRLHALPSVIDYLSFDVDGGAVAAFRNLPLDRVRFRYLTVEHDSYRFGDGPRALMRETLSGFGYELLCPDVMLNGLAYEDWWIDPQRVDPRLAEVFRTTEPTECHRISARRP